VNIAEKNLKDAPTAQVTFARYLARINLGAKYSQNLAPIAAKYFSHRGITLNKNVAP
jgi:hypothetical protein